MLHNTYRNIFFMLYSCRGRIRPTLQEEEDLLSSGIVLQQTDFQSALDELQAAHSDAIGAPKVLSY